MVGDSYYGMEVDVVVVTIVVMVLCVSGKSTKIVVVGVRCGIFVDDGGGGGCYDCGWITAFVFLVSRWKN